MPLSTLPRKKSLKHGSGTKDRQALAHAQDSVLTTLLQGAVKTGVGDHVHHIAGGVPSSNNALGPDGPQIAKQKQPSAYTQRMEIKLKPIVSKSNSMRNMASSESTRPPPKTDAQKIKDITSLYSKQSFSMPRPQRPSKTPLPTVQNDVSLSSLSNILSGDRGSVGKAFDPPNHCSKQMRGNAGHSELANRHTVAGVRSFGRNDMLRRPIILSSMNGPGNDVDKPAGYKGKRLIDRQPADEADETPFLDKAVLPPPALVSKQNFRLKSLGWDTAAAEELAAAFIQNEKYALQGKNQGKSAADLEESATIQMGAANNRQGLNDNTRPKYALQGNNQGKSAADLEESATIQMGAANNRQGLNDNTRPKEDSSCMQPEDAATTSDMALREEDIRAKFQIIGKPNVHAKVVDEILKLRMIESARKRQEREAAAAEAAAALSASENVCARLEEEALQAQERQRKEIEAAQQKEKEEEEARQEAERQKHIMEQARRQKEEEAKQEEERQRLQLMKQRMEEAESARLEKEQKEAAWRQRLAMLIAQAEAEVKEAGSDEDDSIQVASLGDVGQEWLQATRKIWTDQESEHQQVAA